MSRTYTERVGMINTVLASAKQAENHAKLTNNGLVVDPLIDRLSSKLELINNLGAEQKQIRTNFKDKTAELTQAMAEADMQASGLIDTMCGVLGKNSTAAHDLRRIRSRIRATRVSQVAPVAVEPAKAA